jgi:hypothetical protein
MPHYKDIENKVYWLEEGDDPAVWLPNCTLVSEEEANVLIAAIQNDMQAEYKASLTYAQNRINEYPSIGDQLDALFKAGVFPADMAEKIQSVKDKYPKG